MSRSFSETKNRPSWFGEPVVCADTVNLKSDYFFLINLQQPTTPILGETEVGRDLALASTLV